MRSFLKGLFPRSGPEQHQLLAPNDQDLCGHCRDRRVPVKYCCTACLRTGRVRGACSRKCFVSSWPAHRASADHDCGERYAQSLKRMRRYLTPANPDCACLNPQELRALWLDVLVHLHGLLGLPDPHIYSTLGNCVV